MVFVGMPVELTLVARLHVPRSEATIVPLKPLQGAKVYWIIVMPYWMRWANLAVGPQMAPTPRRKVLAAQYIMACRGGESPHRQQLLMPG